MARDGTYKQKTFAGRGGGVTIVTPGNYRHENGVLSFVYIHTARGGREDVMERGRVEWDDGDHFRFRAIDGYYVSPADKGKVYEFRRQ
jgi:hypothetical protein